MKRKQLRQYLDQIKSEFSIYPYEYWNNAHFPIVARREYQGQEVIVETDIIERNPEFLQLLVSVYANDLMSPYFPVGMTLVVERGKVK